MNEEICTDDRLIFAAGLALLKACISRRSSAFHYILNEAQFTKSSTAGLPIKLLTEQCQNGPGYCPLQVWKCLCCRLIRLLSLALPWYVVDQASDWRHNHRKCLWFRCYVLVALQWHTVPSRCPIRYSFIAVGHNKIYCRDILIPYVSLFGEKFISAFLIFWCCPLQSHKAIPKWDHMAPAQYHYIYMTTYCYAQSKHQL